MDSITAKIYEAHAAEWTAARRPRAIEDGRLAAFARRLRRKGRVADLGCGPGWYAEHLNALGFRAVALDASPAMLAEAGCRAPAMARVCADLLAPPFADRSLDGAWASACYQHLPRRDLPLALARLQLALRPGAPIELTLADLAQQPTTAAARARGETDRRLHDDAFAGRLFAFHSAERARALLTGAGFDRISIEPLRNTFWLRIRARRGRTLPDFVRPRLRLLVCGLNPSLYSAERGIPFARPGNRFWPAMRAARLIVHERDPLDALRRGIGMTDLVKRATVSASEIGRAEYRAGVVRIESLVRIYRPRALCFVGLDGWRAAVDRNAQSGWLRGGFGGCPAYLMPSTSGRNANARLNDLVRHLRRAARC
ncbi:MAG: methyltransferase domain-containing protein [Deltaproteobacteria bacterium]|nr:methyltransferase domain-containing protein [Deltaproteobacteria bacterium]MBI3390979.1 methyltransferase domain-containing protein [Deltaproteobacteria bacterium]